MDKPSKKTARTDVHRPGAIIPAHYKHLLSFNLSHSQDSWPVPSFGINCELDRRVIDKEGRFVRNGEHLATGHCCVIKVHQHYKHAQTNRDHGPGKCTVCGAVFVYGDVWLHEPSGEVIFIGHDCADKYEFLADRSEWELEHGRLLQASAVACQKAHKAEARAAFLAPHPGLGEDLALDHPILRDLSAKLNEYEGLSDPQIALARKLAREIRDPSLAEVLVPAPTGKVTFQGIVVSAKQQQGGPFGDTMKITVKVTTPSGVWLAYSTCPAQILDESKERSLRGAEVEISATLNPGRDIHFARASRPRGKIVSWPVSP